MGGYVQQDAALPAGLENETQVSVFEVPEAAVNQPGTAGTRAGCEVALFNQSSTNTTHGGVTSNPGSGNAAADHEEIQRLGGHGLEVLGASVVGKRSVH
jgi:hypothetical protein